MRRLTKFASGVSALALATVLATGAAHAQTPAPMHAAESAQANAKSYRLLWTITEVDGGKQVGTQHYAMVVLAGGRALRTTMKMGSKVPIVTGSYSGNSAASVQTQFQYLDVGLNIDASLEEIGNGLRLQAKVEQSSVADEKLTGEIREPVIRQTVMEGTSMVSLNKPLRLGSLDVPGSTRHLDIEVELENVK